MSDLSAWIGTIGEKHGFTADGGAAAGPGGAGSSGGGAAVATAEPGGGASAPAAVAGPSPGAAEAAGVPGASGESPAASGPLVAGGSGAQAFAAQAEAAAGRAEGVATKVKALETETQTAADGAATHKGEVLAAKSAADQAAQGLGAPPAVSAPQGGEPKGRYDSSIQISGQMRKAQADAQAQAGDVHTQEATAKTAATLLEGKAREAERKAGSAKTTAAGAGADAKAAVAAAKSAADAAATSKAAAAAAKQDDPNKAALEQTAQEDAAHAASAKAAAGRAATAAKAATASAAGAEAKSTAAASALTEGQQARDAVTQTATGLDAKLEPYGAAVTQAETQEAECKSQLSAEDAQAVLERRYEELGGDAELSRALAAEDAECETKVETFRANLKDWQKDRTRELGALRTDFERTIAGGEAIMPGLEAWFLRESGIVTAMAARVNALGDKLRTEPGKEVAHAVSRHEQSVLGTSRMLKYNQKRLKKTEEMLVTVGEQEANVAATVEEAEEYANTLKTELDNGLEMEAMTLEAKVDWLQSRPKTVRDRLQRQLEAQLNQVVQGSIADTLAESPTFEEPPAEFSPEPIDWAPIEAQLQEVMETPIEVLEGEDPDAQALQQEYDAAGGDAALFDKRVAAWKEEVAALERQNKAISDNYREESEGYRGRAEANRERVTSSESAIASMQALVERDKAKRVELLSKGDPLTLVGLTPQEAAEVKRLVREIDQLEAEIKERRDMLDQQRKSVETSEKLSEQHRTRYQGDADDDAWPTPERPESGDIHAMPLKAKYTELTGKTPA